MPRIVIQVLARDERAQHECADLAFHNNADIRTALTPGEFSYEGPYAPIVISEAYADCLPSEAGLSFPVLLLLDAEPGGPFSSDLPLVHVFPAGAGHRALSHALGKLCDHALRLEESTRLRQSIVAIESEREILHQIAMALGSERDSSRLLDLILSYARQLTGSDSGSIYILRERTREDGTREPYLYFANTQSDTLDIPFQGAVMVISEQSIAGYVALHGGVLNIPNVYELPADSPYQVNRGFDRSAGYQTRSMLVIPMRNNSDEIIGVLQLINKKQISGPLYPIEIVDSQVIPYTQRDEQRALALGGQAAVALENSILYEEIEGVFEGFIRASVQSIEARDPVTSGHTERVTVFTLRLARAVNEIEEGPYANTHFTGAQMRELRFAGLLHDIGKIGVREEVLVKAKKLYPAEYERISMRFELIRALLALEETRSRLSRLRDGGVEPEECARDTGADLDRYAQLIDESNEPKVLDTEVSGGLQEIADRTFDRLDGTRSPYLTEKELGSLSISHGTLTDEEVEEIRSHVSQTREFLKRIPWPKDLENIIDIASAHHEKMDGSGYPDGLNSEELLPQARIMAIADIFDALTAADRPYKKALSVERALDILGYEVQDNHLDAELVRIFKEKRVYESTDLAPGDSVESPAQEPSVS